jgi:hypothetical protein
MIGKLSYLKGLLHDFVIFATGFFKDLLYRGPDFKAKKTPIFFLFAKILKEVSVSETALMLF